MKLKCEVIQDLLPLYAEGMVSEESSFLIEEHLKTCENCRRELHELNEDFPIPIEQDDAPLVKVQTQLRKKKRIAMVLTALVTMVLAIVFVSYVTAPKYYLSEPKRVTITQNENGNIVARFGEGVTGYKVTQTDGEEGGLHIYHILTYSTIWDEWMGNEIAGPVVLNPSGEEVTAVYYFETDGTPNKYLYGEEVYQTSSVILLPRLFLNAYVGFALIGFGLSALIAFLGRRNHRIRTVATRISFLPLAYVIGHVLIQGTANASYSAVRDLSAILLVSIPLFLLFLYLYQLYLQRSVWKN